MSIETIGLRAVITSDPRPRDYVNKNIAVAKARRDYFRESLKLSKTAVNKRIEMESETAAAINKINKNGQLSPEPNLSYHKSLKIGSAYSAMSRAAKRFDMTV